MAKFVCTSCKGEVFFTQDSGVFCYKCKRLYSEPSKNELDKLYEWGQIHNDGLMDHYARMSTIKVFIDQLRRGK